MGNPYEPRRIQIDLVGCGGWFRPQNLSKLLAVLQATRGIEPQTSGLDERSSAAFSPERALATAPGVAALDTLHLRRKKATKYHSMISLGTHPDAVFIIDPKTKSSAWPGVFALADQLASECQLEILWVHLSALPAPPLLSSATRTQWMMDNSLGGREQSYGSHGPRGLTMRTYLGPRLVEMLGRDRVLSTPVEVKPLPTGAVRLDLVAEPWQADAQSLRDAWIAARQHLEPAGVFASMEVEENGYIGFHKGPNFVPLPVPET